MARKAKSLATLLGQINVKARGRSKRSDGWIGDARHARTESDHNPNAAGVVRAIDVTNDPAGGMSGRTLAEAIRAAKDKRVRYVIWNRRIFASYWLPHRGRWKWGKYKGSNPHTSHVHVSVSKKASKYDDGSMWDLSKLPSVETIVTVGRERSQDKDDDMPVLKKGASGPPVKIVQTLLNRVGYDCGTVDGRFGPKTQAAVTRFQKNMKIFHKDDLGKVGSGTLALLTSADKIVIR